jgi:hypothetical protein
VQSTDGSDSGGEAATAARRYLELVAYEPDGSVRSRHELSEEELADLRALFAKLPDGRYQIFLVRTDTNTRRLVMDVYVRRGKLIDPLDESEGSRDRPPASEPEQAGGAAMIEQQPALDAAANAHDGNTGVLPNHSATVDSNSETIEIGALPDVHPAPSPHPPAPNYNSLRWGSSLAALAIAAGGSGWSRKVDSALARADRRAWQRLRRAGRLGRAGARHEQPKAGLTPRENY